MADKKPVKKIMLVCTKSDLVDALPPFVMGNGALMEGMEVEIYFTFFGLDNITNTKEGKQAISAVGNPSLYIPGTTFRIPNIIGVIPGVSPLLTWVFKKRIQKLNIPTIEEFIDMIKAGGGKIYACQLGMDVFGLEAKDLRDDIDGILSIGEFYDQAEDDTQIIFT